MRGTHRLDSGFLWRLLLGTRRRSDHTPMQGGSAMRYGRYLCILGCVAALSVAAPRASAAPTEQAPFPFPVIFPGLQTEVLPAVQQLLPFQAVQQTPLQFVPLQGNQYVVSHPGLYWPAEQMYAAQAAAQQFASATPGWSTVVTNGPQGYGA